MNMTISWDPTWISIAANIVDLWDSEFIANENLNHGNKKLSCYDTYMS